MQTKPQEVSVDYPQQCEAKAKSTMNSKMADTFANQATIVASLTKAI